MIEQFLTACWNNAIFVALLAAFVFTVTRVWRHAPLAHLLWLVVLLKLVTPSVFNLPMTIPFAWESHTDPRPEPTRTTVPAAGSDDRIKMPGRVEEGLSNTEDRPLDDAQARELRAKGASVTGMADENRAASKMPTRSWLSWARAAVIVWMAGTLAFLAAALFRIKQFHQVVRRAALASPALCDEIARLANLAGIGKPDVRVSGARIVPFVMAFGSRVVLLLPRPLLSSLSEEERATLLAHELAHLRRRDHWTSWLTMFLVSVYWWHPVAWFARRQLSRAADECCDGWVVRWFPNDVLSYAESMIKTVDFLAVGARPAPSLASGFGQLRSLQKRLASVIDNRTSCRLQSSIRFPSYAMSMLLLLVSPVFLVANNPQINSNDKAFGSLSEEERFPWQPKQLVNVFGTHRGRHWWEVYAVAFSPDGRWIATGSGDKHLRLWDARTMRERTSVRLPGNVQSVVFAPDGKSLAAGLNIVKRPGYYTGQIRVWELSGGELKLRHRLAGFQNRIVSLAFSPNGKLMAADSHDVHLLDMTGPEPREILSLPVPDVRDTLWQAAASPDGKLLAGACGQSLVLWDLSGANPTVRARVATSALSVAFSPDGQTLASGTTYKEKAIHIWSLQRKEPTEQLVLHDVSRGDGVAALAFSPDGSVLASSTGYQNAIRLWKVRNGRPEAFAVLKGHHSKTFALAFSPDGRQLASGSADHSLKLWTMDSQPRESEVSRSANENLGNVHAAEFLPDAQSLLVLHADSIVHAQAATVFKMADPRVARHFELPADERYYFVALRVAPDGKTFATVQRRAKPVEPVVTGQSLASDESSVILWDLASGRRLHTLEDHWGDVSAVAFSPDARLLSVASRDGQIRVWNVAAGKLIAAAASKVRKVLALAFDRNGDTLVSLSNALSPLGETQAVIQSWRLRSSDLSAGKRWETRGSETGTLGVLSEDGKTAAIQRRGAAVEVWGFHDGAFRKQVAIQMTDPQTFVSAISPDGSLIAANTWGSFHNAVSVWDSSNGKIVDEWAMPGDVTSQTFAPDSSHVATTNLNGTIYLLRITRAGADARAKSGQQSPL